MFVDLMLHKFFVECYSIFIVTKQSNRILGIFPRVEREIIHLEYQNLIKEIYSLLHVGKATVGCFLLFHEFNELFLFNSRLYPVMLRRSSEAPQSPL